MVGSETCMAHGRTWAPARSASARRRLTRVHTPCALGELPGRQLMHLLVYGLQARQPFWPTMHVCATAPAWWRRESGGGGRGTAARVGLRCRRETQHPLPSDNMGVHRGRPGSARGAAAANWCPQPPPRAAAPVQSQATRVRPACHLWRAALPKGGPGAPRRPYSPPLNGAACSGLRSFCLGSTSAAGCGGAAERPGGRWVAWGGHQPHTL